MKKAGLLIDPQKGYFKITDAGLALLAENPVHIDNKLLSRYPSFQEFQNRQKPSKPAEATKEEKKFYSGRIAGRSLPGDPCEFSG